MCDREQAEEIVGELLAYLEKADYSIREELVSCYFVDFVRIIISFPAPCFIVIGASIKIDLKFLMLQNLPSIVNTVFLSGKRLVVNEENVSFR